MSDAQVDVLAFGAHPDDIELTVGGSLLVARKNNLDVALCHLTRGEMGTRGTVETRQAEAEAAAGLLGASAMEMLGLPDGQVTVDIPSKHRVIEAIRRYRPKVILAPYWEDLHPDHQATGRLVKEASFLSGLKKWDTGQDPWRASRTLYYMSHTQFEPQLIVDISDVFEEKKRAAEAYRSQFFNPDSGEPVTYIAGENFWKWWEARAAHWGHLIGVAYGEPLALDGPLPTSNPFELFEGFGKYKNN